MPRTKASQAAPQAKKLTPHVRWMILRDIPEVLDIESMSFADGWNEGDFNQCLRQRNCIGMIAEQGDKVIGHMIFELHKEKLVVLKFAVHPAWRRMGVGATMVNKLKFKLSPCRRTRIALEVWERNLDALLFFRSQGFIATAIVRDEPEDRIVMEYEIEREE